MLADANCFAAGQRLEVSASTPQSALGEALEYLIENTFTKMSYLKFLHENPLKEIQAVALHIGLFDLSEERFAAGESVEARLKYFLEQNPGFWGVGVCYEPDSRLTPALLGLTTKLRGDYNAQDPPSTEAFS